jgi:hypothetical protein
MGDSSWSSLAAPVWSEDWLPELLTKNAHCDYLTHFGSPRTLGEFRASVPVVSYEDLRPWIDRMIAGESNVLFDGCPIAWERTSGSTSASKLIPYSADGLRDFQRAILPWLIETTQRHSITGSAYFSISPATRPPEMIAGVRVGLPDGAYLGDVAAAVLMQRSAVPLSVASIEDVERWRTETVRHLAAADDLELISVWSPTFLLRLLEEPPLRDPVRTWPRLRVVSCWAGGASKPFFDELAKRLPHAHLQPKGLISTECVVTVPDAEGRPQLTRSGFFEFERDGRIYLADELVGGATYAVIVTTASGLYRCRTGDLVRYDNGLHFAGRSGVVSDIAGEKLTESFVASCLEDVPGFRLLSPDRDGRGYLLMTDAVFPVDGTAVDAGMIDARLCANPQYAYARRLGQLQSLRMVAVHNVQDLFLNAELARGVRLGDIKPPVLLPQWRSL